MYINLEVPTIPIQFSHLNLSQIILSIQTNTTGNAGRRTTKLKVWGGCPSKNYHMTKTNRNDCGMALRDQCLV